MGYTTGEEFHLPSKNYLISDIINLLQKFVKCNIMKILTKSVKIYRVIYMDDMTNSKNIKIEYLSQCIEDTYLLAEKLAEKLKGGEVILLNGDLGAGKTTFTKGLAKFLGVEDIVTSPTFTFMKEYEGRLRLYHFDMYRAQDEDELYELGLNDYLDAGGVCVIEWNKFEDVKDPIVIDIQTLSEDMRLFTISGADLDICELSRD